MQKSLLRVPFTGQFPSPVIVPRHANTATGATAALTDFLSAPPSKHLRHENVHNEQTVIVTGAGISVASGLADYRGVNGTYTQNKTYRPIYYHEFISNHEARKRYWARSFLGWTSTNHAHPNSAHYAVKALGSLGRVSDVITQNVDSFHRQAHPELETLELHGFLRSNVCLTCQKESSRAEFQKQLSYLNPTWAHFLAEALANGALNTENPEERRQKGLKTNPDGDVDLPDAPYTTFRYPACPTCLANPPLLGDGGRARVEVDADGAWLPTSSAGVLKPAVVMFGESISSSVKTAAERAIDSSSRLLVLGSSLATYSAWRLVKRAQENGMPIGILSLGGARGEEKFFEGVDQGSTGRYAFRSNESVEKVLPRVVEALKHGTF